MLISVKDLKKNYISGEVVTKVLRGLTFNIEQEEFVSIMGPSGSGKSTLMHILGFLDRPSSGKYFLEDEDTTKVEDEELARLRNEKVGFVFQTFNLLPRTTVFDNVRLPLLYSKMPESEKDKRAYEVIADVGMSHRANYFSNQLSGGEQQRVAIARALVNNPAVIFADEPTGNLDSISGVQIMRILQDLNNQGRTIILVTHETYTSEHAKRIISIKDGLIVDDKPVINRRIATDGEILK
ncbi:MAG: ABC transporter ATP-binding protein [bacterium]